MTDWADRLPSARVLRTWYEAGMVPMWAPGSHAALDALIKVCGESKYVLAAWPPCPCCRRSHPTFSAAKAIEDGMLELYAE